MKTINNIIFQNKAGFSMLEMLIVVAIIALLVGATVIGINPLVQFGRGRDAERIVHVRSLHDSIYRKIVQQNGAWNCESGSFPREVTVEGPVFVRIGSGTGQYDLCSCVVPSPLSEFPIDPGMDESEITDCGDYDSGYDIWQNPNNDKIIIWAPNAELRVIGTNLEELEAFE